MLEGNIPFDLLDRFGVYPVYLAQPLIAERAIPNFPDGLFKQFGVAPALPGHIEAVFLVGPEEQMGGIDASPIVATMADDKAAGDWPIRDFPSRSMRAAAASMLQCNMPIPAAGQGALPRPARIGATAFVGEVLDSLGESLSMPLVVGTMGDRHILRLAEDCDFNKMHNHA